MWPLPAARQQHAAWQPGDWTGFCQNPKNAGTDVWFNGLSTYDVAAPHRIHAADGLYRELPLLN